jgi:hypothetical protein
MPLSHYQFRALPFEQQCVEIYADGQFIANRFEEEDAVNLYWMGGFFVELYYDQHQNRVVRTRTFTSNACLDDYACYVKLDDLPLL